MSNGQTCLIAAPTAAFPALVYCPSQPSSISLVPNQPYTYAPIVYFRERQTLWDFILCWCIVIVDVLDLSLWLVLDLCVSVRGHRTHLHRLLNRVRKSIVRAHKLWPTTRISSRPGLCASCTSIIQKPKSGRANLPLGRILLLLTINYFMLD